MSTRPIGARYLKKRFVKSKAITVIAYGALKRIKKTEVESEKERVMRKKRIRTK